MPQAADDGPVRDFDDSTLWRISAFERERQAGDTAFVRHGRATVLPTTLLADLRQVDARRGGDVLEVVAACMRHREPALLLLQYQQLVWPLTLFPPQSLAHSPRDLVVEGTREGLATLRLIDVEPPGARPPGHWMHERVAAAAAYRPLLPLLWKLALDGPRRDLLGELGGRAAYRLMRAPHDELPLAGALVPAAERLRRESAPLREIAGWPGLSLERASRLLNGLYLTGHLLVSRSHPSAREAPGRVRGLLKR